MNENEHLMVFIIEERYNSLSVLSESQEHLHKKLEKPETKLMMKRLLEKEGFLSGIQARGKEGSGGGALVVALWRGVFFFL